MQGGEGRCLLFMMSLMEFWWGQIKSAAIGETVEKKGSRGAVSVFNAHPGSILEVMLFILFNIYVNDCCSLLCAQSTA